MSDAPENTPICERCHKAPAAVHIRRVAEGDEAGLYVCKPCAVQLGADPSLAGSDEQTQGDALQVVLRSMEEAPPAGVCPGCGLSYQTFKAKGRLGCASCWTTFASQMDTLLLRLQGRIRHRGRSPERTGAQYERASKIRRLNDELERAVGAEQYERAAELRDRLKELIGAGEESRRE